jgi:uncharacterized protein (DUF433 family)
MKLNKLLEAEGIIHSDPEIMSGVPVFKGTRIPLQTLIDYLEADEGLAEFLSDFPNLLGKVSRIIETLSSGLLISINDFGEINVTTR